MDKAKEGNVYVKLFLLFSMLSNHVLGIFISQVGGNYLKLSCLNSFGFFFFLLLLPTVLGILCDTTVRTQRLLP